MSIIQHERKMPTSLLTSLKNTGWFGILIERKYGGMGLNCLARVVNIQYLARGCPDIGAVLQIAQLGTASILEFGSREQKLKWLPLMATGNRICTIAITEEQSGSHLLGMKTTYEDVGSCYKINGEKCFIGNCSIANLHVVFAKSKHNRKIRAFIVEGEREGVDNTESHNQIGLRAFPFGKLKLNDVEVPKQNVLGSTDDGLKQAHYVISYHGRPSLTALALGIHHRILDLAYSFSKQRRLYGKTISELPSVREKIFQIYLRFEQSRQLAYEAAQQMSQEKNAYRALSLAKYLCGENACIVANYATDIFGARAGLPEFEIAQLGLDAMMTRPPSGTGDVQKKRILDEVFKEKG